MLTNYKYKWNKKHTQLTKFEKSVKGVVYKEIFSDKNDYIIIKCNNAGVDSCKANEIKYKVKIWSGGHYNTLTLCNNPRQALNYIKKHNRYVGNRYA